MDLTIEDAKHLVEQLQHAHRISVAFYRRILPTLDLISNQLECTFQKWEPLHTSAPPQGRTRPSSKWAWDFVPLFASSHVYWRCEGGQVSLKDVGIEFRLYIDDGFEPEARKRNGVKGEPDAVTLPMGNAVLQAYIFRPIEESKKSFSDYWEEADYPEIGMDEMQDVGGDLKAIAFEWPLTELLQNSKTIVDKLKTFTA